MYYLLQVEEEAGEQTATVPVVLVLADGYLRICLFHLVHIQLQ
jgi:hypothetical protein